MQKYILIIFFGATCALSCMELSILQKNNDDDFKFLNQELFEKRNGENYFKLRILEDFVRNGRPKLIQLTENLPEYKFVKEDLTLPDYKFEKEYPKNEELEKKLLKILGKYKKSGENRYLQKKFESCALGQLQWVFNYPDFPEEAKNPILKALLKKQNFSGRDANDYRQDTYNLLQNISSKTS